jgi:SAM-dependent methyltransferase
VTTEPTQPNRGEKRLSPAAVVFLASLVGLLLELALIRWVSSEVRVFAYCKNLALVASFLGFGSGCLLSRRPLRAAGPLFGLLLLAMLVRLPWHWLDEFGPRRVTEIMAAMSGFMAFQNVGAVFPDWSAWMRLAFAISWTAALFFVVAIVIIPFGQWVGAAMAQIPRSLWAYSLNVAGSLAGILLYTALTAAWMPPVAWFVPAVLCCALFASDPFERRQILAISTALLLVFLPDDSPERRDIWSSYQKLTLVRGDHVVVNNTGYQTMDVQQNAVVDRISMPYFVRSPPGDVLVVGAGTGNDVAAALVAGARSVVAVEIDPAIFDLGRRHHPQAPYRDPRVQVVIDDARHYLKTSARKFDLIVFSHLDAHTVLSSFTNVRLDNYIYTVEAFEEARLRLAPRGVLYLAFFSQRPFITDRLFRNLTLAFGHPPVSLDERLPEGTPPGWQCIQFLTGEAEVRGELTRAETLWQSFPSVDLSATSVNPSTDRWPFLPVRSREIPPLVVLISGVILVLSAAFAWGARPAGARFDRKVFWLGAAFMLVEVHNVSRLALVFGTTWKVNAWVIGTVLSVILAANGACALMRRRGHGAGRLTALGLFASLAAAYLVPVGEFARLGLLGGLTIALILTLPIFFAGLVFADAFSSSPTPSFALGWNVLGAVVGGMAESVSYVIGIPGLVLVAAVFYGLALAPGRLTLSKQPVPVGA